MTRLAPILACLAVPVALAACTGSSTSATSAGSAGANGSARYAAGASAAAPSAKQADQARSVPLEQRDIVRTATIDLTVTDVVRAARAIGSLALGAQGRVDEDTRSLNDTVRHAHLVVRMQPDRLDDLLDAVAALGSEKSRTVTGDDVTTVKADLDARSLALATSVGRLRELLAHSGSVADLESLEQQLTQREADLDSLRAQQRALRDKLALATLTIELTAALPPAAKAREHGPTGFGAAAAGGWNTLVRGWRYLLAGLGYALPELVVVLGAALVVLRRRRSAARSVPATPAA